MSRSLASRMLRLVLLRFNRTIEAADHRSIDTRKILESIIAMKPDLVLDVGANEGQFALSLRKAGYDGKIVSFEPQSVPAQKLLELSASDTNWSFEKCGVGDFEGEIEMHVSGTSVSSSFLSLATRHIELIPDSREIGTETVPVVRLDNWLRLNGYKDRKIFLKLDVQGFETPALKGDQELLSNVEGALVELNFITMFDGQSKYHEVINLLTENGLILSNFSDVVRDDATREWLWADGFFSRHQH